MYWNLKEKKKSLPNLWRAQNGHFSLFGKIVKNDFSSFSPPPMKSTHELSSKSCFSSPWIYALQDKTKKKGGFRVKSWPNVASKQLQSRKKYNKKYIDIACKANFFPSLFETGS